MNAKKIPAGVNGGADGDVGTYENFDKSSHSTGCAPCHHLAYAETVAATRAAFRACRVLAPALVDVPLGVARVMIRSTLAAVDDARAELGLDAGLVETLCHIEMVPDFLKSPADHRRDLSRAWAVLSEKDRLAFLARFSGTGRAAV